MDGGAGSDDWKEIVDTLRAVWNILDAYQPEEKLKEDDHHLLMTRVLPHHPNSATKIGCGVDYIKAALHRSPGPSGWHKKCFYLVRFDGTQAHFSYHKCLHTMALKKNPPLDGLYAQVLKNSISLL